MSNLSDLYISASYYGVVNLSDATEPFVSQSEGRIYLHDGVGEPLGISLDYTKRVSIDNGLTITGSLLVSGSKILTGSLDVLGDITASGTVRAGTGSFDTINTRLIHTTIESSSTIYNSGSNILGDEPSDVQILSGSVYVPNLHYLAGNAKDTNLRINEKLDTGSFNSFSSSLHTQQGVQDQRLTALEEFSSSLEADFVTDTELSAALDVVTSSLYTYIDNADTTLQNNIDKKLDTGSFNSYSSSIQDELNLKSNLTGNNTFVGNNTFSGSVNGEVIPLTIISQTASIDCSEGNFFTLELVNANDTYVNAENIQAGMTLTLQVSQPSVGSGSISFSDIFKFPRTLPYTASLQSNAIDVVTMVTFNTSNILTTVVKNLQ